MADWGEMLAAYLHDPPDKALNIYDHFSRARRYAEVAFGRPVSEAELKQRGDALASAIERLPVPTAGPDGARAVTVQDGELSVVHPLSGCPETLDLDGSGDVEPLVREAIQRLVAELPEARQPQRLLALWRLLPERLAQKHEWFSRLPADTRIPDHTIWQHLDITAGLTPPGGGQNTAFLSFTLGPVQTFIASARSVRDLWTGSMILSWLTFQAMTPVLESLGPTALVYPALRGSPLLDLWLLREKGLHANELEADADRLKAPCLPNRFVAVVPWGTDGGEAIALARNCREAAHRRWSELCEVVRQALDEQFARHLSADLHRNWDRLWSQQVENFFEMRTAVLPWKECSDETLADLLTGERDFAQAFPHAEQVRRLVEAIPESERPQGYPQRSAGQWQYRLELSARLMESLRSVRHTPPDTQLGEADRAPAKCSVMGSYEQMGPADLGKSAEFWSEAAKRVRIDGVRLRRGERLSALALVKRFAGPAFFCKTLELAPLDLRWDDTATIAAATWLKRAQAEKFDLFPQRVRQRHGTWSGSWLHRRIRGVDSSDEECPEEVAQVISNASQRLGAPPAYYAILVMDGDHLGEWLRGDRSPAVGDVMHPQLRDYYHRLGEAARGAPPSEIVAKALSAPRPVGPALHAAISEALANFALHFVPDIVADHSGTLIYAGGDDVVALLPTETVLSCAHELNATFRENWLGDRRGRLRLLMGERASVSAGAAVVHYKEDLRFALDQARQAEKRAKQQGRDALELVVCRRSGEHSTAFCPWEFVPTVEKWVRAFRGSNGEPGASDRWAYRLRAEVHALAQLPVEAMEAEIRRQIRRAEESTRRKLGRDEDPKTAGDVLVEAFRQYRTSQRPPQRDQAAESRFASAGDALEPFVILCQSASFLARGRDV